MDEFSVSKAAFSGYGLLVRKPGTIVVWYLFALIYVVGVAVLGTYYSGDAFKAMSEMMTSGQMDPTAMREVGAQMRPYNLIGTPVRFIGGLMLSAAILRAFLRPQKPGLAYLGIGVDELRLFVTILVIGVIILLVYVAGIVVSVLLGAVGGISGGGFGAGGGGGRAVGATFRFGGGGGGLHGAALWAAVGAGAGALVTLCVMVFLGLKFSLSASQTIGQRSIKIFESWGLTKGRFWKLFAANLLALIALAPVAAVLLGAPIMIARSSGAVPTWRDMIGYLIYPPYSMDEFMQPARISFYLMTTLLTVIFTVVLTGVGTSSYLQIAGDDAVGAGAGSADDDDEDWDDED